MTVDVSSILKETGGRVDISGEAVLADTEFLGEYRFLKPVKVDGTVSNNGKSFIMKAVCTGSVITNCARCMKEITVPIRFELDENLVRGEDETGVDDDVIVFSDTLIEIDDIVRDSFLMSVPGKYLCSEDCKGLCPKCGKDLNEGDCDCSNENIDPRWSALLDIMKENE